MLAVRGGAGRQSPQSWASGPLSGEAASGREVLSLGLRGTAPQRGARGPHVLSSPAARRERWA